MSNKNGMLLNTSVSEMNFIAFNCKAIKRDSLVLLASDVGTTNSAPLIELDDAIGMCANGNYTQMRRSTIKSPTTALEFSDNYL